MDVYTQAFDKLGYDFSMVYVNTNWEQKELKRGSFGGTCVRRRDFISEFGLNNLVLIDTPVSLQERSVWGHLEQLGDSTKHDSTQNNPFMAAGSEVGFLRGASIEKYLVEHYPDVTLVTFLKSESGLKALIAKRIDYWVGYSAPANFNFQKFGLNSVAKIGDVEAVTLYAYLNKKHKALAGPLKAELKAIFFERGHLIE
jgi:hypothetical protein